MGWEGVRMHESRVVEIPLSLAAQQDARAMLGRTRRVLHTGCSCCMSICTIRVSVWEGWLVTLCVVEWRGPGCSGLCVVFSYRTVLFSPQVRCGAFSMGSCRCGVRARCGLR